MYDFADILFSGPCNARCGFCIGRQVDEARNVRNLELFPPRGLDTFIEQVKEYGIRQVVLTGTNTDPQLYRHEQRLQRLLREQLDPEVQIGLHTNGRLALRKMEVFNQYDRVSLSYPSFNPVTYRAVMGVPHPPDLKEILRQAKNPLKISCVVVPELNGGEIPDFLQRCEGLGVRRVALRKLYGENRTWEQILRMDRLRWVQAGMYRDNPVYRLGQVEVTLWDFKTTASRALHLFSSGEVWGEYRIAGDKV